MIERKSGHIINIGSTAAKKLSKWKCLLRQQNTVDALNQGMRMDLNPWD
jgi:NADP-dependent 3-hydroxy acid dehydrogenase YdfG